MEQQEWDWGRRPAAGGLRSLLQTPSQPRSQSLQGQAAGGKGQQRGGMPLPAHLGAAAGLSTKVRLKRDMALMPQAAAAMRIAGPAQIFLHRPEPSWEAPTEGWGGLSFPSYRLGTGGARSRQSAPSALPTREARGPPSWSRPTVGPTPRPLGYKPFAPQLLPLHLLLLPRTHRLLTDPYTLGKPAFPAWDSIFP